MRSITKKLLILFILLQNFIFAQHKDYIIEDEGDRAFDNNYFYVSGGYGIWAFAIPRVKVNVDSNTPVNLNQIGPIYAKIEFPVTLKSSISFCFAYIDISANWSENIQKMGSTVTNDVTVKMVSKSAILRYNWHFMKDERFDSYFGIGLGYRFGEITYQQSNSNFWNGVARLDGPISTPGFESTFGFRYFLTHSIGIYSEVGIAKSIFQIGLVIKLNNESSL